MEKKHFQIEFIREAFHYQSRFEGSTMVFKIDFPVTGDPLFPSLVKDLALLSRTGFRIVIVPGAKELIDSMLQENKIDLSYKDSLRISSAKAMPFVEMSAFHSAAIYMTGFSSCSVEAVIGNFIRARGLGVIDGIDMEHTGTVDKFYLEPISRILKLGMVPILPCIGWNSSGKPYNLPSDEIAFEAAVSLKAEKLFFVSLSEGIKSEACKIPGKAYSDSIHNKDSRTVTKLTPDEAAVMLEANSGGRAMDELALAVKALKAGVERVHIVNGGEEGAVLKELFSNLGSGTMIHADEYESIREIESSDIPDILRLIEPLMQTGLLVRRDSESIESKKDDYAVFVIDGNIRACGALHDWGEGQGEIAAIATDPSYTQMGIGRRIVNYLAEKAAKQGLKRIFALTTRSHDWFESLGFRETSIETLPEKKRKTYDRNRNSKVLALEF